MKQTLYKWGVIGFITMLSINMEAQTQVECKRDFVIKTKTTESTCNANGIIEVTLEGDLSEIVVSKTEYALRPKDGESGSSLPFTKNNILRGIEAGKYIVSVRTFCMQDAEVGVVTESSEVIVGGNYKSLVGEFDLTRMRKSYDNCATGVIAFNVKSGTGYGDLTFHITRAPSGVIIGEIFPVKGSTIGGNIQYELSELYPSGDYQIDIRDNCSTATIQFTLPETTGLPSPSVGGSAFYPINIGTSCSDLRWSPSYPSNNENDHYYKHYTAGMYEIALLPKDQEPQEADWNLWKNSINITLPDSYKNYTQTAGSLVAHVRLKSCNEQNKKINTKLNSPYLSNGGAIYFCDYYTRYIGAWADYDSFWCYPIEVELIDNASGTTIASETYPTATTSYPFFKDYQYQYGTSYSIRLTDASSYIYNLNRGSISFNAYPSVSGIVYDCNSFKANIYIYPNSSLQCYPVDIKVYKENELGAFIEFDAFSLTNTYIQNVEYPYGKYRIEATFNYIDPITGLKYTRSIEQNVLSPRPSALNIYSAIYGSVSYSNEHYGYLRIAAANAQFSTNTRITIVDAPEGYLHKGKTFTSTTSSTNFYLGASPSLSTSTPTPTYMPRGTYTVKAEDDCGTNIQTTVVDLITGYEAQDVKYMVEEDGCSGAYIKLNTVDGDYVKYLNNPTPTATNFKVISGPSGGYETSIKNHSQKIKIVSSGEYVVGTVINTSYSTSYIRRDTIKYEKSKPLLDPSVTSAYMCTDPTADKGYIIFTAYGGNAPYSYELLDADKNPTGVVPEDIGGGRIVFNHGVADETYIVKITDVCGNSSDQEVTLADLKTQSITYTIPPTGEYCTGDEIRLNCITLGQTSYLWEKKISEGVYEFVSNDQNPRIPSATVAHTGVYRVTVTPEYCGEPIVGELSVKVYPHLAAGAVSADQEICVATRASAMTCVVSGGKGNYSYQWQVSTDTNAWTNVANATASTLSPLHTKSGVYYYRLQITDDCHTVTSDAVTIDVKACYIMVNPNIRTVSK